MMKLDHSAYRVGWICPLEVEQVAALEMLDEEHDPLPQSRGDTNIYNLGSINNHNIVIAGLPNPGNCPAATVVTHMVRTFTNLKYILLVGIGGGVPVNTDQGPIRLGHVVVSKPTGTHSGVVQYDHGQAQVGNFVRTGSLPPPPNELLNASREVLVQRQRMDEDPVWKNTKRIRTNRRGLRHFQNPGATKDHLYHSDHHHRNPSLPCDAAGCDPDQRIDRPTEDVEDEFIVVHRGTIASGELVVKDATLRDRLAQAHGVFCFEMEAAGALTDYACLVIRGVSDYSDSHKNDEWHGFAAAVAAAYARQLFFHISVEEVVHELSPTMKGRSITTSCFNALNHGSGSQFNSTSGDQNNNTGSGNQFVNSTFHGPVHFGRSHSDDPQQSKSRSFKVPFSLAEIHHTSNFVAREKELQLIHGVLSRGSGSSGRRTVAIQGFGGIGKTQLAIKYAKQHGFNYSAILWLNARDEMLLQQSYTRTAQWIVQHHPDETYLTAAVEERNPDETVIAVRRWLEEDANSIWLIVYDNYDHPPAPLSNNTPTASTRNNNHGSEQAYHLRPYLPQTNHGAIIITTRSTWVKREVTVDKMMHLQKLDDEDGCLRILAPTSDLIEVKQDAGAVDLAKKLDGLPLALATASAFLKETSMGYSKYLDYYQSSWRKLHQDAETLPEYDRTLYSTWNISYERIKTTAPLAANLLRIWAYFDNEDLWYELLKIGPNEEGPRTKLKWLRELTEDSLTFHRTLSLLYSHELVEVNESSTLSESNSRGYSVHGCVHEWMKAVLNGDFDNELYWTAVASVAACIPHEYQKERWVTERRLMPHAERALETMERGGIGEVMEWALCNMGDLFSSQGKLNQAETLLKQALEGYEKALGREHMSTLITVNNLGNVYMKQVKLDEAETLYQRALEGDERALGREHISTLITVNNLGNVYRQQGKLDEAENMHKRGLEGKEKTLGLEHMSTLNTVNNLGNIYMKQGKLDKAEARYRRSLRAYEKVSGSNMPLYVEASVVHQNLGGLLVSSGRTKEAQMHYEKALSGSRTVFGHDSERCRRLSRKLAGLVLTQ